MIKLTITTKAGTTVSLDIPEVDEVTLENKLHEALSAVVYPDGYDTPVESPAKAQETRQASSNDEEVSSVDCFGETFLPSDLLPSAKRYKSVQEMLLAQGINPESLACDTGEKMEEGEVGGEERGCKGGEGEVEGKEEEKPERIYDLDHSIDTALDLFQFPCENGIYVPPMQLTRDFVLAFGEEHTTREFLKARSWLIANPTNRKTQRGMGRFLNAWLCREAGMKRTPIKESKVQKSDSLLSNGTENSQGW